MYEKFKKVANIREEWYNLDGNWWISYLTYDKYHFIYSNKKIKFYSQKYIRFISFSKNSINNQKSWYNWVSLFTKKFDFWDYLYKINTYVYFFKRKWRLKQSTIVYYQFFYDFYFWNALMENYSKFEKAHWYAHRAMNRLVHSKLPMTYKNYEKEFLPVFNLHMLIHLNLLSRPRNLIMCLTFYDKLFLLYTAGSDFGHAVRKKKTMQTRGLSNIVWHILFREICSKLVIKFLNFNRRAVYLLMLLNLLKYTKRFKNKNIKFNDFLIKFREQFGFLKGKKLAIRKRFVTRNNRINTETYEDMIKNIKIGKRIYDF